MTEMHLLGDLVAGPRQGARGHSVAVGVVTNNQDPDGLGRVKVKLPRLSDADESAWARVLTPMAGPERGIYFLPEVDDEVLVVFEDGQIDRPIVLGALWNGKDKPPAQNDDGKNNKRLIRSRSGHTITLDDTEGAEKITIADSTEKSTIVIDSKEGSISVTSDKDLVLKAQGNITIETSGGDLAIKCQGLSIEAQGSFSLKAMQEGKVEAQSGLALTCLAGVDVNNGALEVT